MNKSKYVPVRMTPDQYKKLDKEAKKWNVSIGEIIRRLIDEVLTK